MIKHDRNDVSNRIDVNKTNEHVNILFAVIITFLK